MSMVSRTEGIVPALEPSHALHQTMELAGQMRKDQIVLVNLCGRGDKDMLHVAKARNVAIDTNVMLTKTDVAKAEEASQAVGPDAIARARLTGAALGVGLACTAALAWKLLKK